MCLAERPDRRARHLPVNVITSWGPVNLGPAGPNSHALVSLPSMIEVHKLPREVPREETFHLRDPLSLESEGQPVCPNCHFCPPVSRWGAVFLRPAHRRRAFADSSARRAKYALRAKPARLARPSTLRWASGSTSRSNRASNAALAAAVALDRFAVRAHLLRAAIRALSLTSPPPTPPRH